MVVASAFRRLPLLQRNHDIKARLQRNHDVKARLQRNHDVKARITKRQSFIQCAYSSWAWPDVRETGAHGWFANLNHALFCCNHNYFQPNQTNQIAVQYMYEHTYTICTCMHALRINTWVYHVVMTVKLQSDWAATLSYSRTKLDMGLRCTWHPPTMHTRFPSISLNINFQLQRPRFLTEPAFTVINTILWHT